MSLTFFVLEPVHGIRIAWSGILATLLGVGLYVVMLSAPGLTMIGAMGVVWPLVIISIVLMLLGVPIVDSLIFGTFVAFLPRGEFDLLPLPQTMTNAFENPLLLAIPFFILAAGLMNAGAITEALMALASSLVGHFRGGLGHVNVLTNVLMGGPSGSSTADAAAIAKMMVPTMERRGFPKPFSVALTSAGSILANMIPPGLGLILYAALAQVSVGALFVASVVPGLLMAVALSVVVHIETVRHGYGGSIAPATGRERWRALIWSTPALVLTLLIVGGIRYGAFTATEAGAVAALYSVLCGVLIYRTAEPCLAMASAARGTERDRRCHDHHCGVGTLCLCAGHRAGTAEARHEHERIQLELVPAAAHTKCVSAVRRPGDGDGGLDGHPGADHDSAA